MWELPPLGLALLFVGCIPQFDAYEPTGCTTFDCLRQCIQMQRCLSTAVETCAECPETSVPTPTPPEAVSAPSRPLFTPCPQGWTEDSVSFDETVCRPQRRVGCSPDALALPSGCTPFPPCSDEWAPGLPADAIYVRAESMVSGGSGTMDDPFLRLSDAIEAAQPGVVIALGRGTHSISSLLIEKNLSLRGACATETRIASVDTEAFAIGGRQVLGLYDLTITAQVRSFVMGGFSHVFTHRVILEQGPELEVAAELTMEYSSVSSPFKAEPGCRIVGEHVVLHPINPFSSGIVIEGDLELTDFLFYYTLSGGGLEVGGFSRSTVLREGLFEGEGLFIEDGQAELEDLVFDGVASSIGGAGNVSMHQILVTSSTVGLWERAFNDAVPAWTINDVVIASDRAIDLVGPVRIAGSQIAVVGAAPLRSTRGNFLGGPSIALDSAILTGGPSYVEDASVFLSQTRLDALEVVGGRLVLENVAAGALSLFPAEAHLAWVAATSTTGLTIESPTIEVTDLAAAGPVSIESAAAYFTRADIKGRLAARGEHLSLTDIVASAEPALDARVRALDVEKGSFMGSVVLGRDTSALMNRVTITSSATALLALSDLELSNFDISGLQVGVDAHDSRTALSNGAIHECLVGALFPRETDAPNFVRGVRYSGNGVDIQLRAP